ncbi:unnamed protein product [Rhizophagus irregularis]|nr:unnamed protein product [Rhizophagus irregularis]
MYMDQLVSADGRYLLTWNEIKINNDTKYKGKIPHWFKDIEDNYTLRYITHHFEWTIHWLNETRQTIFGKTLIQDSNNHSSITYSEHFVPLRNEDLALMNVPNNQTPLVLIPCSGCRLNSYYPSMDARPKCVLSNQTRSLNIFNVHKSASREHKFFSTSMKQLHHKKYFVSTKPHYTLNHVAYNIFLQRQVSPHLKWLRILLHH